MAGAKELARAMPCHRIEVAEEKLCRRIMNSLPPAMYFVGDGFARKHVLFNVEALHKQRDSAGGHVLAAGFRRNQGDQRGGLGGHHNGRGGRGGSHGSRDGRHDGR